MENQQLPETGNRLEAYNIFVVCGELVIYISYISRTKSKLGTMRGAVLAIARVESSARQAPSD